jgi:hypothetical protein
MVVFVLTSTSPCLLFNCKLRPLLNHEMVTTPQDMKGRDREINSPEAISTPNWDKSSCESVPAKSPIII